MGTEQGALFGAGEPVERPSRLGNTAITFKPTASILTKASGFMGDFDYTLNPYMGCSFGCSYCYAASFVNEQDLRDRWGEWVHVKENAVAKLLNMRTDLRGKTIYMSSVTDPYQPIERRLGLVRSLLEILVERGARLVVQTRSSLVTRDIDLFQRMAHVRVNMTITTDSERVRKTFEPECPPNATRLKAIAEVVKAGVPTSITMTPLLPVEDPVAFAERLRETGVSDFVVQPFHPAKGKFVAGTRDAALALTAELGWDDDAYQGTLAVLRHALPLVQEGREGFRPE